MLTIFELKDDRSQCRWPLTAGPPHFFCGGAVERPPYCERCRAEHKPFTGELGKPWEGLAGMMLAVEQTMMPAARAKRPNGGSTEPMDHVLREAVTHFDEPGGLLRRT